MGYRSQIHSSIYKSVIGTRPIAAAVSIQYSYREFRTVYSYISISLGFSERGITGLRTVMSEAKIDPDNRRARDYHS